MSTASGYPRYVVLLEQIGALDGTVKAQIAKAEAHVAAVQASLASRLADSTSEHAKVVAAVGRSLDEARVSLHAVEMTDSMQQKVRQDNTNLGSIETASALLALELAVQEVAAAVIRLQERREKAVADRENARQRMLVGLIGVAVLVIIVVTFISTH